MKKIPDSKIIANVCCDNCNYTNEIKIPLEQVFNDIQKQIPGTKGPIESIYALIEQKKTMKLSSLCMSF